MVMTNTRALLVVQDTDAVDTLTSLLRSEGVDVACVPDAAKSLTGLPEHAPDLVFADFSSPECLSLLENLRPAAGATSLLSVLLLNDESERAAALRLGAHFIIYKPVSSSQLRSVLLATKSLQSRERRRTTRVPIHLPVSLGWSGEDNIEGILLDVSGTGMDVLISRPVSNFTELKFRFDLPLRTVPVAGSGVVAWTRSTGETGVRFENLSEDAHRSLVAWLDSAPQDSPADHVASGVDCKLTDLSLGGCYVESESPFPVNTRLDLVLQARGTFAAAQGWVRVLHPSYGMGIEFLAETEEQIASVTGFLEFLVSQSTGSPSGVSPQLRAVPREIVPLDPVIPDGEDEPEDALLHLLRNEAGMSQAIFLSELQNQRGAAASSHDESAEAANA